MKKDSFKLRLRKNRTSSLSMIIMLYVTIIFLGSLLLSLPISSANKQWSNYTDALFTATSATCVTGLVTVDTYMQWSMFGQIVILFLIETGGIGLMTAIAMLTRSFGFRLRFKDRKFLMESVGFKDKSGFKHVVLTILIGSAIFETLGAAILCIRFIPDFGVSRGIYFSIFHSISAFCNAGFDLMGYYGTEYASFTMYAHDPLVIITLSVLIFTGGLGFIVWDDFVNSRFKFKDMRLHTQIMLMGSVTLIIMSMFFLYLLEFDNALADESFGNKLLSVFFQAITARTAGFNAIDMAKLNESSLIYTIFMMFIGAGPGSTAGGIKVTTFIIVALGTISLVSRNGEITLNQKKITRETLNQALAIVVAFFIIIFIFTTTILWLEPEKEMVDVMFEVVSAVGTVGMTSGLVTASFGLVSKLLLILLMFIGRVGILTIVLSVTAGTKNKANETVILPEENIMVG